MKSYKIFRWILRASALTTVMFVMQACYGSPYTPPDVSDGLEVTAENDTLVEGNAHADVALDSPEHLSSDTDAPSLP